MVTSTLPSSAAGRADGRSGASLAGPSSSAGRPAVPLARPPSLGVTAAVLVVVMTVLLALSGAAGQGRRRRRLVSPTLYPALGSWAPSRPAAHRSPPAPPAGWRPPGPRARSWGWSRGPSSPAGLLRERAGECMHGGRDTLSSFFRPPACALHTCRGRQQPRDRRAHRGGPWIMGCARDSRAAVGQCSLRRRAASGAGASVGAERQMLYSGDASDERQRQARDWGGVGWVRDCTPAAAHKNWARRVRARRSSTRRCSAPAQPQGRPFICRRRRPPPPPPPCAAAAPRASAATC
jgi:hypothetical protein